ncbi:MAG TPA: hypothetical protein ENK62_03325 [Chromatiales bacterium]|nr:hypothetical protein [Chromatiales bacterium]
MSISDYLENKILDKVLSATDFTVTTVYVSLHTADPGETGGNEVSGGSYARQSASFGSASAGTASNSATLSFTDMPAATITHVGLWDASTAGNFLWGGALTASKTTNAGDTFQIAAGDLDVSLD